MHTHHVDLDKKFNYCRGTTASALSQSDLNPDSDLTLVVSDLTVMKKFIRHAGSRQSLQWQSMSMQTDMYMEHYIKY